MPALFTRFWSASGTATGTDTVHASGGRAFGGWGE
jgi:hypothetical protein